MAQVLVEGLSMQAGELTKRENVEAVRRAYERVYNWPGGSAMTEVTAYELAKAWDAWLKAWKAWGEAIRNRDIDRAERGEAELQSFAAACTLNDRAIQEHKDYVAEALQLQGDMSAGRGK